jgi:hypothetical protein
LIGLILGSLDLIRADWGLELLDYGFMFNLGSLDLIRAGLDN